MVKTLPSNAVGVSSIPGRGAKVTHVSWPRNNNTRQKQHCSKFNKDLKKTKHLFKQKPLREYKQLYSQQPKSGNNPNAYQWKHV